MRFIGDVHGLYNRYQGIIADVPRSIQVGDFGIGMKGADEPPFDAMTQGDHRFIRGNRDNPDICQTHPQWIPDGYFENEVMFVGGAISSVRISRYELWPDEELSASELNQLCNLYSEHKPRVMVTHDCPEEVSAILLTSLSFLGPYKREQPSRTRYAFQEMWSAHAPELWIFGHYHVSFDQVLHGGREVGTRFIGLAELEYRDIELP